MSKVLIISRFRDKFDKSTFYEAGQTIEFTDEERVKDLVSRGFAEVIEDPQGGKIINKRKIFIVHGRDRSMRESVEKYVKSLGLEPILLFKQTNKGKTIIEKIERCADDCVYAIVLLAPDDYGGLKGDIQPKLRARQNVILELGYMWGKLGRDKVAMLYKNDVEKPSDADGIVHIPYYRKSGWKEQLKKELEGAGLL